MKQRLLTGSCYVIVLLGFFLLKVFLPDIWGDIAFDVLLYAFTVIGTVEMTRALGDRITRAQKIIALLFGILFIPVFDVGIYVLNWSQLSVIGGLALAIGVILCALPVVSYEKTSLESVGCSLLSCVYPVLLLSGMLLCNHLPVHSDLAILFIFVISPCADSIALVFGMALGKKFPQKMSPHISPKKTVVGGIGGIVGGIVGAVALFFIYNAVTVGAFDYMQLPLYIVLGAVASVATEFGDLVESGIKRKVGIKDMGKLLPGHGGILDRIDGSIYAAIVIYIVFALFFMA